MSNMKKFISKIRIPKVFFLGNYTESPFPTRMFGIELEFFLIDRNGKITNQGDLIINRLKKKLQHSEITQECGESMIEIDSYPHISSREVFGNFFSDFESLLYELENNDMGLYYYGCYPSKNNTLIRRSPRYDAKEKILGREEFGNECKCIGFHCHYSLPTQSFNPLMNFFYLDLTKSKKDKILNLFNMYISLDPALSTFMQSSPYFEGKYLGKDSRIIVYRGDPMFNFSKGVYSKYPEFGMLNNYAEDFKTIIDRIMQRTEKWRSLLKTNGIDYSNFVKKELSILDSSWKPVKVSQHGTIEMRGVDMNSLNKIVASTVIMKNISKFIENNSINITPSETGNTEPFILEDKNLYVPTNDKIIALHKASVLSGLEDKYVYKCCKSFLMFARKTTSAEMQKILNVFSDILEERKTTSDKLLDFVKKKQGYSDYKTISNSTAEEWAICSSKKIFKELLITKMMLSSHDESTEVLIER